MVTIFDIMAKQASQEEDGLCGFPDPYRSWEYDGFGLGVGDGNGEFSGSGWGSPSGDNGYGHGDACGWTGLSGTDAKPNRGGER